MNPQTYNQYRAYYSNLWQNIGNYYYPFLSPYHLPPPIEEPSLIKQLKQQPCEVNIITYNTSSASENKAAPQILPKKRQNQEKAIKPQIIVKDRNILSNNTNLVLSLIRRASKSEKQVKILIEKLNRKQGTNYNCKRFYTYQNYIKQNVSDYRNKNAIQVIICHCDLACEIYSASEQLFFNQVCRILINHYLSNNLLLDVLSLTKIKKTNRRDHLKVQRYLLEVLKGAKSAESCSLYKL